MSGSRLSGCVALVTGGAAGIGHAIVLELVAEGCKQVYVLDIVSSPSFSQAENTKVIKFCQVDISKVQEVEFILKQIRQDHGRLDILVNNAAAFIYERIEDVTEEALDKTFAVNVKGPALTIKNSVPLLKASEGGSVINVSSINGLIGLPGFVPYAASKAAILQLTRNSAVDLGKFNIRVNSVIPGAILTEATAKHAEADGKTLDQLIEELTTRNALPKMGRPEDIAKAVAFLASKDAAFITGAGLVVDGGFTIR